MADRGINRFHSPGFDGYDQTVGEIAHHTVAGLFSEMKKVYESHGWLENMTPDQMEKLYEANVQGWPIEHIATMIWMCEPSKTDYPWPGYGMERKEILAVLTQYRDLREYENRCAERRLEMEVEKEKDVEPDIEPAKMWQKQGIGSIRR